MIIELIILLFTVLIAYFLYIHKSIQNHFKKHDIKYLPGVPMFGNMMKTTFMKTHFVEDLDEVYRAFPDERYVGLIEGTNHALIIRDPELIKTITVKDFDHFVNHKQFFPEELEPLFGGSVFMMKGERWRDMRTTLSPAFTSSKMRQMMPFMTDISKNIVDYLKEHQSEDTDVTDLIRRYTNDVIASAGFGLQVNSLEDKENEFYMLGQGLFNFNFLQRIHFILVAMFPTFTTKLGIPMFPRKVTHFFRDIVTTTMDYREKNNVERPDMIQLLMEAMKGKLKHEGNRNEKDDVGFATVQEEAKPRGIDRNWTMTEIVGQVFLFFVAGFDSSSNSLIMCIHELAVNPAVEEKLYQEIKAFNEKWGTLTYDNITELKYLDCVLNESFRKWAIAIFMDRVCSKTYELPPPREGGKPYTVSNVKQVKPGDIVFNLVNSLHMDPQHFPDPHKFHPERFSDENKHNIKPFTFMPFGSGPRNCIGSRFALLELKVLLYNLVLNFKILKCKKTSDPIVLAPADFNIRAVGGTFVKFEHRK